MLLAYSGFSGLRLCTWQTRRCKTKCSTTDVWRPFNSYSAHGTHPQMYLLLNLTISPFSKPHFTLQNLNKHQRKPIKINTEPSINAITSPPHSKKLNTKPSVKGVTSHPLELGSTTTPYTSVLIQPGGAGGRNQGTSKKEHSIEPHKALTSDKIKQQKSQEPLTRIPFHPKVRNSLIEHKTSSNTQNLNQHTTESQECHLHPNRMIFLIQSSL